MNKSMYELRDTVHIFFPIIAKHNIQCVFIIDNYIIYFVRPYIHKTKI